MPAGSKTETIDTCMWCAGFSMYKNVASIPESRSIRRPLSTSAGGLPVGRVAAFDPFGDRAAGGHEGGHEPVGAEDAGRVPGRRRVDRRPPDRVGELELAVRADGPVAARHHDRRRDVDVPDPLV